MLNLFKDESNNPKINAQSNLEGRTHYVDDSTLRYHYARVLSTHIIDGGLLFGLVESVALDMNNRKRGFRGVIFNVLGEVLSRNKLEGTFSRKEAACKAMFAEADRINAIEHTRKAIADHYKRSTKDMFESQSQLDAMEQGNVAA